MIKYRPKWCPTCKYGIPGRGATSPKCINQVPTEVLIGESKIECRSYKYLRIRSYKELKHNRIYNPYDEFEPSEKLAYYAHEEAISACNKEWIEIAKNSIHSFCQEQLCNKHNINQGVAQIVKDEFLICVQKYENTLKEKVDV